MQTKNRAKMPAYKQRCQVCDKQLTDDDDEDLCAEHINDAEDRIRYAKSRRAAGLSINFNSYPAWREEQVMKQEKK